MGKQTSSRTYFLLAVLFSVEAVIFYSQVAEQITPYYPLGDDQLAYLLATYHALIGYFGEGWLALLHRLFASDTQTGAAFPIQGALLALIGGANRTAMVSLNLLYFIALQAMVFQTIVAKTERVALAWIAVALLMSLSSLFAIVGGIYDYRIDFSALCLYGIWICAVLRTDAFINLRWSVLAGLIGALLISTRYLTITYVGTITFIVFVGFVISALRGKKAAILQAQNSFLCGTIMLLLAGPILFAARNSIYAYYGIGHLVGKEKYIRAAEMGLHTLSDHLLFYPQSILWWHLGVTVLVLAAGLLTVAIGGAVIGQRSKEGEAAGQNIKFDLAVLGLGIVVPLIILTIDISKSPVVGGIVSVPIVLFFLFALNSLRSSWLSSRVVVGATLVVGFSSFIAHANNKQTDLPRPDLLAVNRLNTEAARYILDAGLHKPRLAFDRVVGYLNALSVTLKAMEHVDLRSPNGLIDPVTELGGIFAVSRAQALAAVEHSDLVVLTDQFGDRSRPFPFNDSMRKFWPDIARYVKANFFLLDTQDINGIPHRLYVRPIVKVAGVSGDWITSAGLTLTVDQRALQRFPQIVLKGDANYTWLGGEPKARAISGTNKELPVTFAAGAGTYQITIDASALPGDDNTIKLTFDRFFVPKKLGINEDTRELAIYAPKSAQMVGR